MMKSCALAAMAAATTSASVASGRPSRRLSPIVPWNSMVSCDTTAIMRRSASGSSARRSCPSIRTLPDCGSYSRSSSRTIDDLPEPLGPTMPTRSPGSTTNDRPRCAGAPAAGIGEAHVLELDARAQAGGGDRPAPAAAGAASGVASSVRMPCAAAWPFMPWCSTVRRSRSGRKISVPAISTISSAVRLMSPWLTRQAPSAIASRGAAARCRDR